MLQVKTYLNKSDIHGFGVFAMEDIRKGRCTWRFNPDIDKILTQSDFTEMETDFLEKYAFFDSQLNIWILSADNDRFTNHSDDPNTIPLETGEMVACRDIKKGEEITSNYFDIDGLAEQKDIETDEY